MGTKFRLLLISRFYYNPEKSEIKGSLGRLKRCQKATSSPGGFSLALGAGREKRPGDKVGQKDGMEVPLYV